MSFSLSLSLSLIGEQGDTGGEKEISRGSTEVKSISFVVHAQVSELASFSSFVRRTGRTHWRREREIKRQKRRGTSMKWNRLLCNIIVRCRRLKNKIAFVFRESC